MPKITCFRCGQEVAPGFAMHFEGERPVHKGCYGKEIPAPKVELPQVFSWMTVEEFVGRSTIAMTILLTAAAFLL